MDGGEEEASHPVLTREKLLELIRTVHGDDAIPTEEGGSGLRLTPGVGKGENYSSELFRLKAEVRVKGDRVEKIHWMIKMSPSDPVKASMLRLAKMDTKEVEMYSTYLPALRSFLKKRNLDEDLTLNFCPCLHTEVSESHSVIVLEDLSAAGCAGARGAKTGLSRDYCVLMLAELARFHAAGHAYLKSFPGGLEAGLSAHPDLARDYLFTQRQPEYEAFARSYVGLNWPMLVSNLEACQDEPGQDYPGMFKRYIVETCGSDDDFMAPLNTFLHKGAFKTIVHGDLWFNNIMFKHDPSTGCPTSATLLDLALTRHGSPASDLAYFFMNSVDPDLRRDDLDGLLAFYCRELASNLAKLGEDPNSYPLESLKADYTEQCYYGFLLSIWFLPSAICNKEDALTLEDFVGEGDAKDPKVRDSISAKGRAKALKAVTNCPQIKKMVSGNIREMLDRGIFKKE